MAFLEKHVFKNIQRFFNFKLSADSRQSAVKFQLPGFSYADLDRTGQVNICSLNRLVETSRLLPYVMKDEQFLANPIKGSVMVMLGQIFTIQPHVYKKFVLDYPMELENRLIAVSKSTFVRKISLSEIKTGSEVVSVLQKLVHMDMATKKSCKLPQKVLDLLMDVKGTDVQDVFQNIVPQQPTEKAFTCTQMVKHSDMDFLMHTNQGTYMRFAFDCAAEAASQNGFQVIKEDICRYQVVKANTLHMSETFAGDKLIVKVWDDDVDPYRLHCAIFKNKTNVFYVSMNLTDDVI